MIDQHIGIICGSENNLVVVASIRDSFIKMVEAYGAIILSADEKNRLAAQVFDPDTRSLKRLIIGKSARFITEFAGIRRDKNIRLIIVPMRQHELQGPYGHEKLAPILSLYVVNDEAEGIQVCKQILINQGRGHRAVIYTQNEELMKQFGREIEASRILVNTPASQGCIGIGIDLTPSFTLGLEPSAAIRQLTTSAIYICSMLRDWPSICKNILLSNTLFMLISKIITDF